MLLFLRGNDYTNIKDPSNLFPLIKSVVITLKMTLKKTLRSLRLCGFKISTK